MSGCRPNRRELGGLALGGALAGGILAASTGAGSQTAREAGPNLRLRRGVSVWPWFSLTQEYPAPRTDYAWPPFQPDRSVPTRRDLDVLARLGLDFIRLPVDPGPFVSFTGSRRSELLSDVMAGVGSALDAGLKVVLDLHPNDATHHWTSRRFLGEAGPEGFEAYLDLIRTVAGRLSAFDPARVGLEPMNEPPPACGSPDWPARQDAFLAAARGAAPRLTVILTGACGGTPDGLAALAPVGDPNVLYSFHLYEPYVFSHQGATWMATEPFYRYLNTVPWPGTGGSRAETRAASLARLAADTGLGASDRANVARELERVIDGYFDGRPDRRYVEPFMRRARDWAAANGVPADRVLLGEFGALRTDARYLASRPADRARYVRDMRQLAESYGFPWAFWNLFDGFGLFGDDRGRVPDPAIVDALGLRAR